MSVEELKDKMKIILSTAEVEERNLTAEEKVEFENLSKNIEEIRDFEAKKIALEKIEFEERNKIPAEIPAAIMNGVEIREDKKEEIEMEKVDTKMLIEKFLRSGGKEGAEELRANGTLNSTTGFKLPIETTESFHAGSEMNFFRQYSTSFKLRGLGNIPLMTAYGLATIKAEGSDSAYDASTATKVEARALRLTNTIRVTDEMMNYSVNLYSDLEKSIGYSLTEGELKEFLTGDGIGNAEGIFNLSATKTSAAQGVVTFAEMAEFDASLPSKYRVGGKVAYVCSPTVEAYIRTIKDANNNYIFTQVDGKGYIFGKEVIISDFAPVFANGASALALVNFRAYGVVDRDAGIVVEAERKAMGGYTNIVYSERIDGRILDTSAFKILAVHA